MYNKIENCSYNSYGAKLELVVGLHKRLAQKTCNGQQKLKEVSRTGI